jgi:hypothetical protein
VVFACHPLDTEHGLDTKPRSLTKAVSQFLVLNDVQELSGQGILVPSWEEKAGTAVVDYFRQPSTRLATTGRRATDASSTA